MKVLVTGAAGAIGSHMVERLIADGHQVIGIDALTDYYDPAIKLRTAEIIKQKGCEFYQEDLTICDLDSRCADVEAVFHFAAQPGIANLPYDHYFKNNVIATLRLLEALKNSEALKLFVNISTSSVYGTMANQDESVTPNPISPYGHTKLAAEQIALWYGTEYSVPVVALRLFSVYGERERPDKLYHKLIKAISESTPFPLHEGSEQHLRSYTYVGDVVDACMLALEKKDSIIGEVINIGNDAVHTTGEGIEIIESILGKKAIIEKMPKRSGDQQETRAVIDKARNLLGYDPKVSLRDGLEREVMWYREMVNLK